MGKERFLLFSKMVERLDLLKMRYIQAEYLNHADKIPRVIITEDILSMEQLLEKTNHLIRRIEEYIPEAIQEFLEYGDKGVYTCPVYGNKFWNEIDLPPAVNQLAEKMSELMGTAKLSGQDGYELVLYDLSDFRLYFNTLDELEAVISEQDVVPFTVFELSTENGVRQATELYCA